jgi:thiol:disulfide interchange protein DsbD
MNHPTPPNAPARDAARPPRHGGWQRAAAWLLACGLLALPGWARPAEASFLDADQAFVLSPSRLDSRSIELRYDIAPGYHLYRDRFSFEVEPQGRFQLPQLPPGQKEFDPNFDKSMAVYRGLLRLRLTMAPVLEAPARAELPSSAEGADQPIVVSVTSQGCADQGLCYPPQTQRLRVVLHDGALMAVSVDRPGSTATGLQDASEAQGARVAQGTPTASADTGAAQGGEWARIQSALKSGNLFLIAAVFAAAGLLLSFTPCMLPMVPILSSIIVGQGGPVSRLRGFGLAAAYSLGMACVYTVFGVVAGLLGEGLAAALQNPWVLGAFALLLVGLSLSMFGLYQLQMPGFLQSRVAEASGRLRGGRFVGVFVMGGLSALIVGPCVAAPLAGALVYISQTRDVLIGGVALFALACGMSAPLLLVGLSAGTLLPRAGPWMEGVKQAFGFILLAVAIWLVAPVMPAWIVMAAVGTLLLLTAVYLRAFDRLPDAAGGWPRFFKGVGVLMALVGSAQFVGVLSGGRDPFQPLACVVSRASPVNQALADATDAAQGTAGSFRRVRSLAQLDAVLKEAGKPVMLDFYADWCSSCQEYERFTFADPQVRRKLGDFVLLRADVTANSDEDKALMRRFHLFGPPGIVFFDSKGQERPQARVMGYQASGQFLGSLDAARS